MKILLFIFSAAICCQADAQETPNDSATTAAAYYKIALQYKDGNGVKMDYNRAVEYFSLAANLGDPQSIYALAYMHYKGLGCKQDYLLAARLFSQGAYAGKENSMYFYGLCFRNGYGVTKTEDSARYWLQQSADLGYKQAVMELKMPAGENSSDSAKALLNTISNAAMPVRAALNQYNRIESHIPRSELIAGYYYGYIVQYDWSGQNAVSSKKLTLNLRGKDRELKGYWSENGIDSFEIKAGIFSDSLKFDDTKYKRTDHYSPDSAVRYDFKNASLNLVQKGDSIFIAGNVTMFSPDRKEPSKPLTIVLYRIEHALADKLNSVVVSPNPFVSSLNVEFNLSAATSVTIQLLTAAGTVMYESNSGKLSPGHYLFPLQPGSISHGTYLLKLVYGNSSKVVKVIHG